MGPGRLLTSRPAAVWHRAPFLVGGAVLGAELGGVGVTDRLLLLRMGPAARVGEMFGFYGLVGKLSAVIGPFVYGQIVAAILPDPIAYTLAILSLLALLAVGLYLLLGVSEGGGDAAEVAPLPQPAIVPPGEAAR